MLEVSTTQYYVAGLNNGLSHSAIKPFMSTVLYQFEEET